MMDRLGKDEGAVLPLVAILLVVLLLIAAFVVDLGGVRVERAANQVVADAAASAAALTAGLTRDGAQVCEDAKQYVALNSASIGSVAELSGIDCSGFVTPQCTNSTAEHASSTTVNGVFIEIAYPVADGSTFMTSRQIGAPSQPASAADGGPCDRVGVRVQTDWAGAFSGLVGAAQLPADVHAVADRKSTRLNSSHVRTSRMPSSA